ncbi:MAG TPA: acyl-CoA dehydrogenase family protein [Candidatus Dormibacteraeota bacterium]|jgi:alkylation response protein AidB-like acyl-CoA dehydrogenase|nr:acyl-CoA dehydrogenase family protein [Candidatus Dormibacteraeota bacterium]
MATTTAVPKTRISGGSFLLEERSTDEVFTPEDFSEQHRLIAQTAEEFAVNEILPNVDKIEHKDFSVSRDLLKKAGELGLSGAEIPEAYGGLEMDKVTAAVIVDHLAKYAGFATTWGAHSGIGLLPIVYFGTEEQKQKYLPRLAAGEIVGAYALSEASSGSDALNCRARAELSSDGKHYILNGEKMWITNAGFADLFTVFAKIDGEKFTAFLVERTFPGFSVGAEEHKLGIRGSSTCPIILNDCKVPVENLLGDIGKGHVIAFNILNVGRFKLGAACLGGARVSLGNAITYAKQRKAFDKVIADFGLIREKIANMATLTYVGESLIYRTVGMMDVALNEVDKSGPEAMKETRKAIEEYAVECSIIKVWASEMVDYVVDETMQIYGGYGFVEEYPAERAYRDARINRIFEGTNEINRLIITGFLLKRAMSGQLPLMPAIKKLMDEVLSGPSMSEDIEGPLAEERKLVSQAKKLGLFAAGSATQKYMQAIQDRQEIMGAIADMTMETYAMESAVLRAQKIAEANGEAAAALPIAMTRVYLTQAMEKIESAARKVIAAVAEGDMLRTQMAILRRLAKHEPFNTIELRQQIAERMIERGKYTLA